MELEQVKRLLEDTNEKLIEELPERFINPLVMAGLQVDLIEPGHLVCSMKIPPRLLNKRNMLHWGATATLVDMIGSAVIFTVGAPSCGVSVNINITYLDAAYVDEEIEIDAKTLRIGKAVGVVGVELRRKSTGKIIAQGRHTKYLAVVSKL